MDGSRSKASSPDRLSRVAEEIPSCSLGHSLQGERDGQGLTNPFSGRWVRTMITIQRPGRGDLQIEFILIDFDGTLASDRRVHPKAKDKINLLSKRAKIYILTNGEKERVAEALKKVNAEIIYFTEEESFQKKLELLRQLGAIRTLAVGNGVDDGPMIQGAGFGLCVIGKEGASAEAVKNADVVFTDILDALDFLLKPLRQKATLGK